MRNKKFKNQIIHDHHLFYRAVHAIPRTVRKPLNDEQKQTKVPKLSAIWSTEEQTPRKPT